MESCDYFIRATKNKVCLSLGQQTNILESIFHLGSQLTKYKNYDSTGNWVSQAEISACF